MKIENKHRDQMKTLDYHISCSHFSLLQIQKWKLAATQKQLFVIKGANLWSLPQQILNLQIDQFRSFQLLTFLAWESHFDLIFRNVHFTFMQKQKKIYRLRRPLTTLQLQPEHIITNLISSNQWNAHYGNLLTPFTIFNMQKH